MSDNLATPTHINSTMWNCMAPGIGVTPASAFASVATSTANMAVIIPLALPWPYTVRRVFWCNGSGTLANAGMGIYSEFGAKIYASASTAQSGVSAIQYVALTTPIILGPGKYYLANVYSGTANQLLGGTITASEGRVRGYMQQAIGSATLPASLTVAQFAQIYYPLCGITRTSTGF